MSEKIIFIATDGNKKGDDWLLVYREEKGPARYPATYVSLHSKELSDQSVNSGGNAGVKR